MVTVVVVDEDVEAALGVDEGGEINVGVFVVEVEEVITALVDNIVEAEIIIVFTD